MIDFTDIGYLREGNRTQRAAYEVLSRHSILEHLKEYDPILVGTIPINIDIEGSDLDVVCCCDSLGDFGREIESLFGGCNGFLCRITDKCVVANFHTDGFEIEIYGDNKPTRQQNAYRHMVLEHEILECYGEGFRKQIIDLKQLGVKTEPAFAKLLGLDGDPYEALLGIDCPNSLL